MRVEEPAFRRASSIRRRCDRTPGLRREGDPHRSSTMRASTTVAPAPGSPTITGLRSRAARRGPRPAASAAVRVTVSTRLARSAGGAAAVAPEQRVERATLADQPLGRRRIARGRAPWRARRTAPPGRRPGRPSRTGRARGLAGRRPAPRAPRPSAGSGTPRRAAGAPGRPRAARRGWTTPSRTPPTSVRWSGPSTFTATG